MTIWQSERRAGRREGRKEGRIEGRAEGFVIGRINIFQEVLGLPESEAAALEGKPLAELEAMARVLRRRWAKGAKAR